MPKAKDTEYGNRLSAAAERTEYPNNTAVAEKTEHAKEKTEYQDRTATAEKAEFTDEKTEHRTQYPAENRDNSYLADNQHMVKFSDELRGINDQAALNFDRRKNPAEYDLKEKEEMLEAVTEAFNATSWNSANERRLAADDIAQNVYHPMYPRVEIADAAVQHKLPGEFIQELKQEKIEYFETKQDEAGVEALQLTVKDIETAERMVEQSGGKFHIVSTRNLDHYRDQFADALYSSDRNEGAAGQMESSLDDAIRLYNGDVSHVRRWDETLDEKANFWEPATEQEGESDQQQAQGQLEPTDRELTAFSNLQSMDEYTLDHSIRDLLNEKLSHTQEYLTELQVNQHPDANAAAQVHEILHEISHDGINESVEKGNGENFVQFMRHIEGADEQLALEMRERNGFIEGWKYVQTPENPHSLENISNYSEKVREQINEHQDKMPSLNYDITDKLLKKLDIQVQMVGEPDNTGYNSETAEDYHAISQTIDAVQYTTRADDPVFWKLREMNENDLDSEIQIITNSHAAQAISNYLETNGDPETQERTLLALNAIKGNDDDYRNYTTHLADAVNDQDHAQYKRLTGRIESDTTKYAEILSNQSGEIWVEEKLEHPVHFTELNHGEEFDDKKQMSLEQATEFDENKRLYLEQATEFANHYGQAVEEAEGNSHTVLYLADGLLLDYQAHLEVAAWPTPDFGEEVQKLDAIAKVMASLLKEKQPDA